MHYLFRLIVVFVVLLSTPLRAFVFELPTIAEILPYVREDSLVVIGVHGILLDTAQMLGSEEWGEYEMQRRVEKEEMSPAEAMEDITPVWHRILLASPMKTPEETTMGVVRQLQKRGNKVLGVSRHEVELAYLTLNQLRSLDIDLSRSAPIKKSVVVSSQPYAKYIEGILFVGTGGDISSGVTKLVKLLPDRPKHILYVDTKMERINDTITELAKLGIETQGLRLKIRDGKSSIYLPAVAAVQLSYLGKMLPDREAHWLIDLGFGVKP